MSAKHADEWDNTFEDVEEEWDDDDEDEDDEDEWGEDVDDDEDEEEDEDGDAFEAQCFVLRETPKALMISLAGHEDMWIPRAGLCAYSQVHRAGQEGLIAIKPFFAKLKGLIDDDED